jgi:hypothetical protein
MNSKFKQEEHKTQGWGVQTRSTMSLIGWGAWSREGGVRKGKGCGCNGGAAATVGLMDALLGRLAFSTPCGNTLPCWKENAAIGFSWTTWSCCRLGLWRWPTSHGWLVLTLFELMLCHYQCWTILFNVAKPSPVTIFWLKHIIHVGGFHIDHMCNWRNNICFYWVIKERTFFVIIIKCYYLSPSLCYCSKADIPCWHLVYVWMTFQDIFWQFLLGHLLVYKLI